MSAYKHKGGCKACEPVRLAKKAGMQAGMMEPRHPLRMGLIVAWEKADVEVREAWHAVSCCGSRLPEHLGLLIRMYKSITRETIAAEKRPVAYQLDIEHRDKPRGN